MTVCEHDWRLLRQWDWQGVFHNDFYCTRCLAITDRTLPKKSDLTPLPSSMVRVS